MEIYRVAFIGHREVDEHRQVADELDTVLSMLLKKHEYIEFYVGKNGEFDELAASAVRRLKSEWSAFCSLALVLPYEIANLDLIEKSYDEVIIKEASPRTKVVIVTSLVDPDVLKKARNGAADSLWYKDHGTKDIIDVMVRTMNGERVFPESSPNVTLKDIFSEDLTPKQMKILRYFVKGYTYEEIAQELDMTKRNVRWHLDNIVEKSGYENKYELLIALIDSKLIVANLTDEE